MNQQFSFTASLWLYPGKAGWYFVTVPEDVASEIDFYFAHTKRGFGSLPVSVTVGSSTWKTSIFPDKKSNTYLLPIKAKIRQQEQLVEGSSSSVTLEISD